MYIDICYICTCFFLQIYMHINFSCLYLKINHIISLYFQLKFRQLSFNLISSILHLCIYLSLMLKVFVPSITNLISNYLNSRIHSRLRIKSPMLPQSHVLSFFFFLNYYSYYLRMHLLRANWHNKCFKFCKIILLFIAGYATHSIHSHVPLFHYDYHF